MERLTGCCACFHVALCHSPAGSIFSPVAGQREGLVILSMPAVMESGQSNEAWWPFDKESHRVGTQELRRQWDEPVLGRVRS